MDQAEEKFKSNESENEIEQDKSFLRSASKAWVYFCYCFLEEFDKNESGIDDKIGKMLNSVKGKRKGGKRKPKVTEGKEGFENVEEENQPVNLEKLLAGFLNIAERRICSLWKEPLDEESYLKLFIKIAFNLFEKKEILQNSDYRQILKKILRAVLQQGKNDKKGLYQVFSGRMIHILYNIVKKI